MSSPDFKIITPKLHTSAALPLIIRILGKPREEILGTHIHDCTELWYVLSGEATHKVGEMVFNQKAGTCITVPPFVPHSITTPSSDKASVVVSVNIFDNTLRSRGYDICSYYNKKVYFNGRILPVFRQFTSDEIITTDKLIYDMGDEFFKKTSMNFKKLSHLITDFLSLLGGEKADCEITPAKLTRLGSVLTVTQYINEHYSEKLTIEELCGIACMSKSRLSEYFNQITGIPIMQYLKITRLKNAYINYVIKGKKISQIVEDCGFYSKPQLSRFYKEHFGMTMTEHKKKIQKKALLEDLETRYARSIAPELSDFFSKNKPE